MKLSKKTVYALRAIFVLAQKYGDGPVTIAAIAEAQVLPSRFLENILFQLKGAGILDSARGREGGYWLARPPSEVSIGDVLRVMETTIFAVDCLGGELKEHCPMRDNCAFLPMWSRAHEAMVEVYDGTSYEMLVRDHKAGVRHPDRPADTADFL